MNIISSNHRGFSLIEVLVALLVLSLGLIGLAKFHGKLLQSGSDANQLSVATTIAEEKIEQLRSFDFLVDNGDPGIAYENIADGQETLTPSNNNNYNTSYNVTWKVQDCYMNGVRELDAGGNDIDGCLEGFGQNEPAGWDLGAVDGQMYKAVTVDVDWSESDLGVTLTSIIESADFRDTFLPPTDGDGSGAGGDVAETTDILSDEVQVDVDTDSGQKRQAGKPLPEVVGNKNTNNTLVAFDVITYTPLNNPANEASVNLREEFLNVACECQFTGEGPGYIPGHVQWSMVGQYRFDSVNTGPTSVVNKTIATPTGNNDADVEGLCTLCCRDHHDGNQAVRYDGQTGVTGNHEHYDPVTGLPVSAVDDVYLESCRFKRIDGVFRVFQDWKLQEINVIPNEQLLNNATLADAYSDYVADYLVPDASVTSYSDVQAEMTDVSVSINGTPAQLLARGIYLDQVYKNDATGELSTGLDSYAAYSGNDKLEQTPFAEVNLTLLADWDALNIQPPSESNPPPYFYDDAYLDEDLATIDVTDSYYGNLYRRGQARGQGETPNAGSAWPIYASIENGTDGITDNENTEVPLAISLDGENPDDPNPADKKFGRFDVAVAGAASVFEVSGNVSFSGLPGGAKVKTISPSECSLNSSGGNANMYTCLVVDGTSFTFTVSFEKGSNTYSCNTGDSTNQFIVNGSNITRPLSFSCS